MTLADIEYNGQASDDDKDLMWEQFCEFQKIIKSDFQKFIDYKLCNYKDNEALVRELMKFIEKVDVRPCEWGYTNKIYIGTDYLYLDMPIIYNRDVDLYDDKDWGMKYYNIIIKRDYKEFFFISTSYFSQEPGIIVKVFKIVGDKVENGMYSSKCFVFDCSSDEKIDECVKSLKKSIKCSI